MDKSKRKAADVIFAVLRIATALVCGNFLYTFIVTMCLGQINAGDVTGSLYCIAVILLVIFYPRMKRAKLTRTAARISGAGLIAFAVYCAVISGLIASEMMHGEDNAAVAASADGGTAQTVIVLGCKTINGEPSPMLALRLNKAIEYMNAHPSSVCILTGGQGSDEIEPEAVSMHRYMTANDIAEERIYTEEFSENTTENIRNSAAIIAAGNLPTNVVVVSECYHIYRGVRQARLAGLYASGIYPDPSSVLITMPSYWLREIFAVSRDIFLG